MSDSTWASGAKESQQRLLMPVVDRIGDDAPVMDEWATRYGFSPAISYDLADRVGSRYVGFAMIHKRGLAVFREIPTVIRNESDDALDNENAPGRVKRMRSPYLCSSDLVRSYHKQGFTVLETLTGKEPKEAWNLFTTVLDTEKGTLVKTIDHLKNAAKTSIKNSQLSPDAKEKAEELRVEMLRACQIAHAWTTAKVMGLEKEMEDSRLKNGVGKSAPDPKDLERYQEIERSLPENRAGEQQAGFVRDIVDGLGRAIQQPARALPEISHDERDAELAEMRQQMKVLMAGYNRLLSEQPPIETLQTPPQETATKPERAARASRAQQKAEDEKNQKAGNADARRLNAEEPAE
jgi:hypothetical protein